MRFEFEGLILSYINNAFRQMKVQPLNLGGLAASGGGVGMPPGGYIGVLPQTRVAYDYSEEATPDTTVSGISLLDNLNHIRYRIEEVAASGIGEAPVDGEQYVRKDADWYVVDAGHVITDEGIELPQRSILNFVGDNVSVADGSVNIGGSPPTFDAVSSAKHTSPDTYLEWSHIIGAGTNRMLIVAIAMRAVIAESVTYNGVNLTKIRSDKPGGDVDSELWYLGEDDLPVSGTYTIRVNGSTSQQWIAGAVSYSGCYGLGNDNGNNGSGTSGSVTLVTEGNQVLVDVCALQSAAAALNANASQVERWDLTGPVGRGGCSTKTAVGFSTDMSWTFSDNTWAISVVALRGIGTLTDATIVTVVGCIPTTMADSSASNNLIYYSTDQSALVYKDSEGNVHALY